MGVAAIQAHWPLSSILDNGIDEIKEYNLEAVRVFSAPGSGGDVVELNKVGHHHGTIVLKSDGDRAMLLTGSGDGGEVDPAT